MNAATAVFPHTPSPNWAARYEQQLPVKMRNACEFVQANRDTPGAIRSHFQSLLTLFSRAQERPWLHPLAADLITALHPLPYRWGFWQEWLHISRQGAAMCAVLERPLAQADLLAGMVDILFELARHDEAVKIFAEMRQIPLAGGVIRPFMRAGHRVSTRLLLAGKLDESLAAFEQQSALLAAVRASLPPEDELYAGIYQDLQETLIMRRQHRRQEAVAVIEKVLKQVAAWTAAPAELRREVHHHHGGIRLATGEFVLSAAAMDQAIACAVEMDDPFATAALYLYKAYPLWSLGRFAEVETAVRQNIHLCENLNARWQMLTSVSTLVDVLVVRGEFAEALTWSDHLISLAQQLGNEENENESKTIRAIALLHQGSSGQAGIELETCLAHYREKHSLRWQSLVEANLSLYWAQTGDAVRGRQFAQNALLHAQEIEADNLIILAWRSLSRFQTGREKKESLWTALKLAREHHMLYAEASVLLLLAACHAEADEQAACWRQAVDMLHEMGLTGWLNGRSPQNPPHLPLIA